MLQHRMGVIGLKEQREATTRQQDQLIPSIYLFLIFFHIKSISYMWQRICGTCMESGQWSSLILVVSWSFVWAAYLCLDLSNISKAFDGSMLMGVIFYSSSFYVLIMWEWCPCHHHGCLMSRTSKADTFMITFRSLVAFTEEGLWPYKL